MLNALIRRLVDICARRRWIVLAVSVSLAAGAAVFAANVLRINTDTDALFDADLPFRVADDAYDRQFPADTDLIVAVIDGPSKIAASRAADRLAADLTQRTDLFRTVRAPEGGPFFAHNALLYLSPSELEELSARLAQAQPLLGAITADRSARGLFHMIALAFNAAAEGDAAAAGLAPAAAQTADVIDATLDGKPKAMNWSVLLSGLAAGDEKPRAFVLLQPRLDMEALEQGGDASAAVRATAVADGLTPARGFRVRLTGSVPLSDEEFATLKQGTGLSGVAAVVLVTVLLTAALGALRLVGAVVITLLMGLLLTMGWAAAAVGEINLISVAFAVMFVGIAVDFAIQFCMRYRAERRVHSNTEAALAATGATMANPLLLAAIATALGFFSFLPTAYRGVAQLGVIAGGGMIIALILSFTALPALIAIVRGKADAVPVGYLWAAPLNRWLVRRRMLVLVVAALFGGAALVALPRLTFDFDPLKLKDPTTESMSTVLDLMGDPWSTPNTLNVLVSTPEAARAMADKLGALPEVREALTVFDFVPEDQEQKLASIDDLSLWLGPALQVNSTAAPPSRDDIINAAQEARARAQAFLEGGTSGPDNEALAPLRDAAKSFIAAVDRLLAAPDHSVLDGLSPALASGLDDVLEPLRNGLQAQTVTMNDLPEDLRASWIAKDGRYRIQVFPKADGRDVTALADFLAAVRRVAPDASGPPATIYESGRIVTHAFATAAALALVSITGLLFVVLRRPADVGRVLAPLLLAGLLTLGTCAAIGFPLNFANIIALPLLLGVGVTFPIYLVTAWRDGEGLLLTSPSGRGMLFSALTTAAAFGSLALSRHPGTAAMGELLAMALGYVMLTTLFMLPALLGAPPTVRVQSSLSH
ncbi:MAG: hopanoid biosynthesis-associated RND transporter HpnN [Rhodospirillaceae bacterium]|nr:MAG: hopanoid biosynthesis-associated RND transporter HpnN [Rhodospirillaceae bacterium]